MLRESGRLPFALLWPFVSAGYAVQVDENLRSRLVSRYGQADAELPPTARCSLTMDGVSYTDRPPSDTASAIYLFDTPRADFFDRRWRKRIRVRFDMFSPYPLRMPVIAPYAMHPLQAALATTEHLDRLRRRERVLRILFAGDSKGYVRNRIRYPHPKLPRHEVLQALRRDLTSELIEVTTAGDLRRLSASGYVNAFVLSDSGSGIAAEDWLPTLADADFFLCPPGMVMPMCHNVIEAMAVGTIPLISYPEWMRPRLRHLHNCIEFSDRDDLLRKVRLVLSLPPREIAELRRNVIEYYEDHLRPTRLVDMLEAHPERDVTLLLHTELNTARHAARLGPRSALLQGDDADGALRRFGRWVRSRSR
jgi:hypothetical protein